MPVVENIGRRQCIPILYTRGTHYEVGFDVGRNFAAIINSFIKSFNCLNEEYLPAYNTPNGLKAYNETLQSVKENFPQYIEELQGTADGAKVSFHELFLLHMDNIILSDVKTEGIKQPFGCSTVCVNQKGHEILGHTEDALVETLNHFYFVSAHIVSDKPQGRWKVTEEKFTSLCYAGHLPGYTMGYNHHGLVFSVNTISAKNLQPGKIPRHFITRSLLSATNFEQTQSFIKCQGAGVGDACSLNMTIVNNTTPERIFYNIEMAPSDTKETKMSIVEAKAQNFLVHTNSFQRLNLEQGNIEMLKSSDARLAKFKELGEPKTVKDVKKMLGDASNCEYPVFRNENQFVATIATGIFDLVAKTWTLYSDNCFTNEPLVVLPLVLKNN